jgi:hypothetical protein
MHASPVATVLIFGSSWAAVTALRVVGAAALGAYRGATKRLEPEAITSLIFGLPAIANVAVAAIVTTLLWIGHALLS